ncbi:MAG TPA: phytanoyl-CoA dioxygenase family protein [Vicinamibacterales bacterium]|nr:phytanoyl-CoA dioxygenase family protein [Vicinamibacterales bacterium]
MDDWFSVIASGCELPATAVEELNEVGFVVIAGPVPPPQLPRLAAVYDAAVAAADPADIGGGRTTTRVWDFVNRAPEFDRLYVHPPLLEACCRVIGAPFHLSTMHARAVNAGAPAQDLHVDYRRTTDHWPMVGFIFMVDEFRRDNGATRFVPGSHRWPHAPSDVMQDATADYEGQVSACGPAGSVVVYNGSVWHGHAVNHTAEPRRSIQGAYIRRDDRQGTNQSARMRPDTLARLGPLAKYVLNVESELPVTRELTQHRRV